MSMAEYILKLRGYIKSRLRHKQDIRALAYVTAAPKEPMTTWWPNPLDTEDGYLDESDMMDAWMKANKRHDQRTENKD